MADSKDKQVPDQGGVGFTKEESGNIGGKSQPNQQSGDPGKDAGASNGRAYRPDVPDQSGVGFLPDDNGKPAGGNRQG